MSTINQHTILIAEDDADDRLMIQEAFSEIGLGDAVRFVEDGQELMTRLGGSSTATPSMIIIDLNMPRKDGREALRDIKEDSRLRRIPVVVLTTSKSPEDIRNDYSLGANCYITKPVTFEALLTMVQTFQKFWFGVVRLPSK